MSLGPGVPDPPTAACVARPTRESRHRLGERLVVRAKSVLGGLHQCAAAAQEEASNELTDV